MTPLKNWATANFVAGAVSLSLAIGMGIPAVNAWIKAERTIAKPPTIPSIFGDLPNPLARVLASEEKKKAQPLTFLALLFSVVGLWSLACGASLNRANALLGETFLRCPFCLGGNVVFNATVFTYTGRIICRDCHALWQFHLNMFSMSLTRLRLVDYGIALREEEENAVPNTDNPEQWRTWAKERFKRGQRPSPVSLPQQGQALFCRFCGHPNLPDANFCSACGRKLKV